MNEHTSRAQLAMLHEKECIDKFAHAGWTIVEQERLVQFKPGQDFRPDLVLKTNKGYEGFAEVRSYRSILLNERFLAEILRRLLSLKPDFLIITNGTIYDLYLFGEFYGRLSVTPSPDDIDLLLSECSKECK